LIIIGGGSAAFAAATRAREYGAEVTIINEGLPLGGTCVNVGCVPSKALIRAVEHLDRARRHPFDGIESDARLGDFAALIRQKETLVESLRNEKYLRVLKETPGIEVIPGRGEIEDPGTVRVGERRIRGNHLLIATGARPDLPTIAGLGSVEYLTSEEALKLEELPESLIVIGGSYIALELAQSFARLGTRVTLLQRSSQILSHEQRDLAEALAGYLREEGIEIVTGNMIQSVSEEEGSIHVRSLVNGTLSKFSARRLLVATGRRPNTEGLNLEACGIRRNARGGIDVDRTLQSSVAGIYAAGDVTGERMFVYTAAYEGKLAVDNMFSGKPKAADYDPLPWVVFTDPQVAGVGLDEADAAAKKIPVDVSLLPLSAVPRAIVARDTRGFVKLIRHRKDDRLLGARILAPEGSELLMEASLAIRYRIPVEEIKEMLHPYLTLGEAVRLAAIAFDKDLETLSCCAT
jgi:mercuric reductase